MMPPAKSKVVALGVVVALAVGGGVWAWRQHQAEETTRRETEIAWNRVQTAETARLAAELASGLDVARQRLEAIAAEARRRIVLSVVTNPAGAILTLSSTNATEPVAQGTTPFSRELPKGIYHLSLKLTGHESHDESVVLADANQSLRIDLRPVPVVPPRAVEPAVTPVPKPDASAPPGTSVITRPQLIAPVTAEYPADLRLAGISGSATVTFTVDASGRVTETKVETSSHPGFAAPAEKAVQKRRYKPAQKDGQPISYRLRTTIRFSLD